MSDQDQTTTIPEDVSPLEEMTKLVVQAAKRGVTRKVVGIPVPPEVVLYLDNSVVAVEELLDEMGKALEKTVRADTPCHECYGSGQYDGKHHLTSSSKPDCPCTCHADDDWLEDVTAALSQYHELRGQE